MGSDEYASFARSLFLSSVRTIAEGALCWMWAVGRSERRWARNSFGFVSPLPTHTQCESKPVDHGIVGVRWSQ